MERYITDERTGLKYELVGDYYLIAGEDKPEEQHSIGIWGCGCPVDTSAAGRSTDRAGRRDQRHLRYLKEHRRVLYANLLTTGKLNGYLADVDQQAEELFARLTKQMAAAEGITEQLKVTNSMTWVGKMNHVRNRSTEIVNNEIIFI